MGLALMGELLRDAQVRQQDNELWHMSHSAMTTKGDAGLARGKDASTGWTPFMILAVVLALSLLIAALLRGVEESVVGLEEQSE